MKYNIDDVIKDDKGILIRGFVLSEEKAVFTIIDSKTDESIPCEVTRFKYKNVLADYEDAEAAKEAGFFVRINQYSRHLKLEINADGKNVILPVVLEHDYSPKTVSTLFDKLTININKTKKSLKKRGIIGTAGKAFQKIFLPDRSYQKWLEANKLSEQEIKRQKEERFDYNPLFSIVVPLFETKEQFLMELVNSVKEQTYSNWELCFSDGSRDSSRLKGIIGALSDADDRIKYTDEIKGPLGISANTNQAIGIAAGDYIVLGDHDDLFTKDALYECVKILNESKVDLIYTDEDKTDSSTSAFFEPHFKPDFNIGFFRSNNYICHMFVAARHIVDQVGNFDDSYNGAQDYDYILRCAEVAESIVHIPKILYHWRFHMDSTAAIPESKLYAYEAGRKAVSDHYKRLGISADVRMGKDYGYYDSEFDIKKDTKVSVISYEFGDSIKKINEEAKASDGEYIVFLNKNLLPSVEDWKEKMLMYCQFSDVGAVGARIFYSDESVCHAGLVLGIKGCVGNIFQGQKEVDIYHGKSRYVSDYSGVSGLCLMTSKKDFLLLGGFDEKYNVSCYDMDYCLRLRKQGKRIVYQPSATFVIEDIYKKQTQTIDSKDKDYFINTWNEEIKVGDPYYNPNLSLKQTDYRVMEVL